MNVGKNECEREGGGGGREREGEREGGRGREGGKETLTLRSFSTVRVRARKAATPTRQAKVVEKRANSKLTALPATQLPLASNSLKER